MNVRKMRTRGKHVWTALSEGTKGKSSIYNEYKLEGKVFLIVNVRETYAYMMKSKSRYSGIHEDVWAAGESW